MEPAGLFAEALSNVLIFSFLFVFNAANWIKRAGASPVYFPLRSEPLATFSLAVFNYQSAQLHHFIHAVRQEEIFSHK